MEKIFNILILNLFLMAASCDQKENASKTGAKSFNEEYEYIYLPGGSCKGGGKYNGRMEKCTNLTEYKELCNLSKNITTYTRDLAAVLYSGSKANFIGSRGGYYEGFNKEWQDSSNRCAANFTISGILDGTTTNMTISGTAYSFIKLDGEILINGISEIW